MLHGIQPPCYYIYKRPLQTRVAVPLICMWLQDELVNIGSTPLSDSEHLQSTFLNITKLYGSLIIMPDWQTVSAAKREANAAKIPKEWRLPESTLGTLHLDADLNVLDIPRKCGILSEREMELTEKYDATGLLEKMASGQVR